MRLVSKRSPLAVPAFKQSSQDTLVGELKFDNSLMKPKTRTAATRPDVSKHLSTKTQRVMETEGEAQHEIGPRKESLIRKAQKKSEAEKPR